tara:strand:+ start:719 stop:2827 length:2109 start_codon:yes stop_codon:yes gene_type:complete
MTQSYLQRGSYNPRNTTDPSTDRTYNQLFTNLDRKESQDLKAALSAGDGLKQLAAFSKTAGEAVVRGIEKKAKKDYAEGLALAYEQDAPQSSWDAYNEEKGKLKAADVEIEKYAAKQQKLGISQEVVHKIKNMSKWKAYGLATGLAKNASLDYADFLEGEFTTNDTLKVLLPDGREITPKTAKTNAEKAAVLSALRNQFFEDNSLTDINPMILGEHAFPTMKKVDSGIMAGVRKQNRIEEGTNDRNTLYETLGDEDFNFNDYLLSGQSTTGEDGKAMGYAAFFDETIDKLKELADAGKLDDAWIDKILNQKPTHANGKKKYKDLDNYANRLIALKTYNSNAQSKIRSAIDANDQAAGWQIEKNFEKAELEKGQEVFTDEELEWWADEYSSVTGDGEFPDFLKDYRTVDEAERAEEVKQLEKLRSDRGYLLESDLVGLSYQTKNKYLDRVQQDKPLAEASLKGVTQETDGLIQGFISTATNISIGESSKSSPTFNRIYMRAIADFEKVFMDQVRAGTPIAEAQNNAIVHVRDKLKVPAAGSNKSIKIQLNDLEYNAPFQKIDISEQVYKVNMGRDQIDVDPRVIDTQVLAGSEDHLEVLKNNIEKGITTIPSYYKAVSDSFPKLTDWELADKQLKASGHPGLDPNPVVEELNNLPELKRYFYYRLTPNRVQQNIGKTEDINNPQEISYFNRNQDVLLPGLSIA